MAISVTTGAATNVLNYRATLDGGYEVYDDTVILHLLFILGEPNIDWGGNEGEIEPRVSPFEYTTYPHATLRPNTYYEYKTWLQAFPHGSAPYQSYFGEVKNFTTSHLIVTTQAVTDILTTSVTANGTITDHCRSMERGFEYYKDGVPETPFYKYTTDGTEGAYSKSITGLLPNTKYYIRTYVRLEYWDRTESEYTYYITIGDWVEFTTLPEAEVTTEAISNVGIDHAKGNGTVTGDNITERGFEVRFAFAGTLYGYIEHSIAGFSTGTVSYNLDIGKWEGTIIKTVTETGIFSEGAFTDDLGRFPIAVSSDKLFGGETYDYRARATISETEYHGDWVEFTTSTYPADYIHDDISDSNPIVPIIPIEPIEILPDPFVWELPDWELPELPPWIYPDLPDWEFPDYPPMSFVGDFYYRKPYTKKDLDDLRKKCITYSKNSIEFALVLRHNMNVLREFFNMMTDYMGTEEFNDFTDLIPPQRLKELYLDPLELNDFRDMINGFIRNTIDNNMAVNRNFKLIQDGLSEYETESDDAYFKEINSNIKTVTEDSPDVDRLKNKINELNNESTTNFTTIMHNLKIIRARLL